MIETRFRQEPCDLRGYDAWQDREGLADASKAARAAWEGYRDKWRRVRHRDLAPVAPSLKPPRWYDTLSVQEQHAARRARALGAQFAMCAAERGRKHLTKAQRAAWFRWRQRVLRADPGVWLVIWPLVDGEPLEDVTARLGIEPFRTGRQVARACSWLLDELYRATSL